MRLVASLVMIQFMAMTAIAAEFGCLEEGRDDGSFFVRGRAVVVDGDTIQIENYRADLISIEAPPLGTICRTAAGDRFDCGQVAKQRLNRLVAQDGPMTSCLIHFPENQQRGAGFCGVFDQDNCIERDYGGLMTSQGYAHSGPVGEFPTSWLYWQGHYARIEKRGFYAGKFPD